jgi:hypothetical protein
MNNYIRAAVGVTLNTAISVRATGLGVVTPSTPVSHRLLTVLELVSLFSALILLAVTFVTPKEVSHRVFCGHSKQA